MTAAHYKIFLRCYCWSIQHRPSALFKDIVVLIDSGAQRSFIHKSVAKNLRVSTDFKDSINLGVFGQISTTPMKVSVSKVGIRLPLGGNLNMEVSQIEQLMSEIAIYSVQFEDDTSLSNSVLRGEPKIFVSHLVIGIDYFWHLKPTVIRTLPSGFTLLKSSLGMHLSGRGRAQISNVCLLYEQVAYAIVKDLSLDTDLEALVRRYFIQKTNSKTNSTSTINHLMTNLCF